MQYTTLLVEKKEKIGTITFNRPDKLNAFSEQAFSEFIEALYDVERDSEISVVVITGAGRAFSAGLDLDEARQGPGESGLQVVPVQGSVAWIPHIMRNMTKPIIATINGHAVGAGFTIALACDIRIASEEAQLGAPFVNVGLVPELGSTYYLPRLIGIARACELVFTGKIIDANEAEKIGLVNQVVPADQLAAVTKEMALGLAKGPSAAIGLAKMSIYQGLGMDMSTAIEWEARAHSISMLTEDMKEGIKAFKEKREPQFKGK